MKNKIWISSLLLLLFVTVLVSLTVGKYPLSLGEICSYLSATCGFGSMEWRSSVILKNILVDIRLPRILAALIIGAALSVSGVAFQSMFINPLVSPSLLGVLSGASFGAALGMIISNNWLVIQGSAFLFGFLAVLLSLGVARLYRADRLLMLLLGGIISGALFTSLLSIIKYLADPYNQLPAIVYWLMGGLSLADGKTVLFVSFPIALGVFVQRFTTQICTMRKVGNSRGSRHALFKTTLHKEEAWIVTILGSTRSWLMRQGNFMVRSATVSR